MKTHDMAKLLTQLAAALRNGPNVELGDIFADRQSKNRPSAPETSLALTALASMSQFDKSQWRQIIQEFALPIEVKVTESTRDVVGKVFRHLEQSPEARQKIKTAAQQKSNISPELMKALDFLLK